MESESMEIQSTIAVLDLNVYDCCFHLEGNAVEPIKMLKNEFRFFLSDSPVTNGISVEILDEVLPYEELPTAVATTYTPRNIALTEGDCTYIAYSSKALGIWDRSKKLFRLYSSDPDYQYEAIYLFLLSRIGELLDVKQMHRIHSMALSYQGKAILAILPMGGGKSTICSALLQYQEFNFLSDDSPMIGADGSVHAFPLRLGLLPGNEKEIPEQYVRHIQRMEFGPKVLVDYEYFAHRVQPSAEPGIIFLGRRSLSEDCRIEPVGMVEQYKSILADCVVGLGLYQGLEFVMRSSPLELFAKVGIAWSRFSNARKLFAKSKVYRLVLGRDRVHNAETVRAFIHEQLD